MNIVFLDIDGVLQPYDTDSQFISVDNSLVRLLSKRYNTDYSKYDLSTLASVYYDWDEQAVARLKYALKETDSKIIVSSDWRNPDQPYKMPDLLKIHGLNSYWLEDLPLLGKGKERDDLALIRAKEIQFALNKHRINNFVVLDDMKAMKEYYPNNSVITYNTMSINDMNECIRILRKK
ncbi:MAG: hypothetical protein IJK67_01265 [Bacilli bacterium]|nr:hypothetical protein [Bacilli bacterium]